MLRYKTKTRPGLVALYNIRPGNGASQFLQPRSPHGAKWRSTREDRGTRNLAIADKPRDAFVQTQWRGWPKNMPFPI